MQFFKLDSDYKPGDTVPNFDTLVWVERYQDAGDFQLVVDKEVNVLSNFPLGTLVSHTDTTEVMIVENHEVKRGVSKDLKITLSGRSFETFGENRITSGSYFSVVNPATGVKNTDTAIVDSAQNVAALLLKQQLEPGTASSDNAIPGLSVSTNIRSLDSTMQHVVKRGDLYQRVLEYLRISGAGIKTIRPLPGETGLDLVVHDGVDLTDLVVFYSQYEDLEDDNYFWSIKDYKNYVQVAGHIYARLYRNRDVPTNLTGLNRRVMYVEADDLEGDYTPPAANDIISARGQVELDNHKPTALLQAKISNTAKPKFKIDYDVGDIVTVFGEFATSVPRRVTEHIMTYDKTGMRGYPTLSAL
jgi:Siphovirus ReqiPepy6 Gp37-like protein